MSPNPTANWRCPKCESRSFDTGELRGEGGGWSSFFDINTRRFLSVSCNGCGYTEFYRETASTGSKILDLLGSG